MKDYHQILGIQRDASEEDIKKAYYSLSKQYHPDLNPNNEEAAQKFKEVTEAFEMLTNPQKKQQSFNPFGSSPFASHFSDFFRSAFGGSPEQNGEPIVVNAEIEMVDVLHGKEVELKYQRNNLCDCHTIVCSVCGGSGKRTICGQAMTVMTRCDNCQGVGSTINRDCDKCHGSGYTNPEERIIKVNIPPGAASGMKFRHRGEGQPSKQGRSGDLYIVINVKEHNLFERVGNDLLYKMPISYTQLVLGAEIEVPTLEGTAKVNIFAGTKSGTKFRLKGLGFPGMNNRYDIGDFLIEVRVKIPTNLSVRHREVLNELNELIALEAI
jgi:molecular chaperone DnaJ